MKNDDFSPPSDEERQSKAARPWKYPTTPDGRYFVVRGRLWRCTNPDLRAAEKAPLVAQLMDARRALRGSGKLDVSKRQAARAAVDDVKRQLGERGPVWWHDGAPDYNRHLVKNSPYADWFANLPNDENC